MLLRLESGDSLRVEDVDGLCSLLKAVVSEKSRLEKRWLPSLLAKKCTSFSFPVKRIGSSSFLCQKLDSGRSALLEEETVLERLIEMMCRNKV